MDGRVQILLAILTVIGSGVSSGIVVYLLNARKEHVFFMRDKVEETCSAATEYMDAISAGASVFTRILVLAKEDSKAMSENVYPEYQKLFTWNSKFGLI
jgi:pheromone shutdown protein TraB